MEHQWNDSDGEKPKYLERNLPHCHFFHHTFTQADLVTGWQLTTWVLVQPIYDVHSSVTNESIIHWRKCQNYILKHAITISLNIHPFSISYLTILPFQWLLLIYYSWKDIFMTGYIFQDIMERETMNRDMEVLMQKRICNSSALKIVIKCSTY